MTLPLFRIDSFAVPATVLEQFRAAVTRTMAVLADQPGMLRMQYFEKEGGAGRFNIVTLVEWQDEASQQAAIAAVQQAHAASGFDPRAFVTEHGIEESKANYLERPIAA